jgi:DNA-binding GntR family transcriptional regulator
VQMRDRIFYEAIAEQSGNSALIEALARIARQIQLCGTIHKCEPGSSPSAAVHGCGDIIQAFRARDVLRGAFLVPALISCAQEEILSHYPNEAMSFFADPGPWNRGQIAYRRLPLVRSAARILVRRKAIEPKE